LGDIVDTLVANSTDALDADEEVSGDDGWHTGAA